MRIIIYLLLSVVAQTLTAQKISSSVMLSNGETVDISHIFLDGENPTFYIEQSDLKADWTFSLYTSSDMAESVVVSQSNESSSQFSIDIESIFLEDNVITRVHDFYNNEDSSHYFKGNIQIQTDHDLIDRIEIIFNLLPSNPIISNVEYEYIYDWNDDMIFPNGDLYVTIEAYRADYFMTLSTTDPFCFNFPILGFGCTESFYKIEKEDNFATYHSDFADWGDFYSFWAVNKYGFTVSDTILTTDYITDPAILARIEEIKNSQAGTDYISVNNINISVKNNILSVSGDKDSVLDISIYDMLGRAVRRQESGEDMDISSLKKGCYVIICHTKYNHIINSKIMKL